MFNDNKHTQTVVLTNRMTTAIKEIPATMTETHIDSIIAGQILVPKSRDLIVGFSRL